MKNTTLVVAPVKTGGIRGRGTWEARWNLGPSRMGGEQRAAPALKHVPVAVAEDRFSVRPWAGGLPIGGRRMPVQGLAWVVLRPGAPQMAGTRW